MLKRLWDDDLLPAARCSEHVGERRRRQGLGLLRRHIGRHAPPPVAPDRSQQRRSARDRLELLDRRGAATRRGTHHQQLDADDAHPRRWQPRVLHAVQPHRRPRSPTAASAGYTMRKSRSTTRSPTPTTAAASPAGRTRRRLRARACATRIFMGTVDSRLIAVDSRTGRRCAGFGKDGEVAIARPVDNWKGESAIFSAPVVVSGVVAVGSFIMDNLRTDAPPGTVRLRRTHRCAALAIRPHPA